MTKKRKWRCLILATFVGWAFVACASAKERSLRSPSVIKAPSQRHSLRSRRFQGIPSLAVSPNGRLWATWYAGKTPSEDKNNYVVISTSGDGGKTWTESLIVDPDGAGPVRGFDPELWVDPTGKLWAFWGQGTAHKSKTFKVWTMTNDEPDKDDSPWSPPRRIADGVMMCKPTVLSTGEWLLPAAIWHQDNSARIVSSTDQGRTWGLLGACNVPKDFRNADEHMVVERRDKSLWMLIRTKYGLGESVSTDRGKTWSTATPAAIKHATTRFFIRRLRSGNLLLVKHGPIDKRIGRSHLTAFISNDDGKTWSNGLLLDERETVSYPDGQQGPDGTIYLVYDRSRMNAREILMAKFTEDDVFSGKLESEGSALRMVVSKYPK